MKSVVASPGRPTSAAVVVLALLTTPLFIDTRPAVRGDDKPAAKPLPAELARAIREGDLKAVRAQLDAGALFEQQFDTLGTGIHRGQHARGV